MRDKIQDGFSWLETGAGEPIVFLHAMAGSKTAWSPQLSAFASRYRCIAWDMPGFGDTIILDEKAGMSEMVEALHFFMTEVLGLKDAHFVGLSVGGMILQHFAYRYPQMMKSMTIMDSSPKFGLGGDMAPSEFADPMIAQLNGPISVGEFSSNMVNAIVASHCTSSARQEAIDAMSRASKDGLVLAINLIAQHDALANLCQIAVPALIIAGENDAETPPAYARRIAAELRNAEIHIIDNAGHIVNLENPEQVNKRLRDFWKKTETLGV
jgi:3-oxoadipate enol-lactonase